MLRAIVTGGAYTANTDIPLQLNVATNGRAILRDNKIEFLYPGIQDIKATIPFTLTTAGTVSMQMYVNGNPYGVASTFTTSADDETVTFSISDVVRIFKAPSISLANISFRINADGTLPSTNNGIVVVEYRD